MPHCNPLKTLLPLIFFAIAAWASSPTSNKEEHQRINEISADSKKKDTTKHVKQSLNAIKSKEEQVLTPEKSTSNEPAEKSIFNYMVIAAIIATSALVGLFIVMLIPHKKDQTRTNDQEKN